MIPVLGQFGLEIVWAPALWWSIVSSTAVAVAPYVLAAAAAAAISIGVSYLTQPRPPKVGGTPLDISAFPRIDEGAAYMVIFGTVRIDGYDAEWVGDTLVWERERSDVVVYRYYYAGAHFIYCRGPVDGLKQLWSGDPGGGKVAWPTVNDPTVFAADGAASAIIDATLYGGPYEGGHGPLKGTFDILLGTATQARNAYLAGQLGSDIPAFRGVASIVAERCNWGCIPTPQVLAGVWKRVLIQDDGAARWYIAKAPIGADGLDLNAIHILRECMCNPDWGERHAAAELGSTWTTAADTLYAESFGLNGAFIPEPGSLKEFVRMVLETIDAGLYDDPETGLLEIQLTRPDYTIADLPKFTRSDFEITGLARPAWLDIPGHITFKGSSRLTPQTGMTSDYIDRAIIDKQGRDVPQTVVLSLICTQTLLDTVAARKGRAMTARAHVLELKCKRTMSALHRGQPFVIEYDDPDLAILQMVVRPIEINYGGSEDQTVTMSVVEDVYAQQYTILGAATTGWTEPTASLETATEDLIVATHACSASFTSTAPA
jgi:hypothetical protein